MNVLARLRSLARMIFRAKRWRRELNDELRFHIEERADQLQRSGMTYDEAVRRARVEFGAVGTYTERCREAHGARWLDELSRNLVYAWQSMRKSPGFTAVAVLSLTLGIGTNIAVFGVLQQLLLTKLPVRDPGGLYQVILVGSSGSHPRMPYPRFLLMRDNIPIFDPLFGWGSALFPVTVDDGAQPRNIAIVSGAYFDTLGLRPAAGRLLTDADESNGEISVISYRFWRSEFGGDPGAIGRSLKASNDTSSASFQIVGVAPRTFSGLEPGRDPPDVFLTPYGWKRIRPRILEADGSFWFHAMARLKPGVSPAAAQALLSEQWPRLDEPFRLKRGNTDKQRMVLEDGSRGFSQVRETYSQAVLVLAGLVAAVFLIVCANLATLLFVRGTGRTREMSIRIALGAGRWQLVRQWMTECLLLSVVGGFAALVAAHWITDLLLEFVDQQDRPWLRFHTDTVTLTASILLTLVAGGLFGLLPGIRATSTTPDAMLKAHSGTTAARRGALAQGVLAVQLAASLVLVVGAVLFARTLWNLNHTAVGFDRSATVYANVMLREIPREQRAPILRHIADRVSRSPHVLDVSMGSVPILNGGAGWTPVTVPGYTQQLGEDNIAWIHFAAPRYFKTIGIPVVAGRGFDARDGAAGALPVVIVNEAFARHYFGDRHAVGQHIDPWRHPGMAIVGVVQDSKERSPRDVEKDCIYYPIPATSAGAILARARPGVATSTVEADIREVIDTMGKGATFVEVAPLEDAIQASLRPDRLVSELSATFGLLGILLASIGLYGAIAHSVSRRTREIGIRIAVGAGRRDIVWMVLKQALGVAGLGILIGLPASVAASQLIGSLLFGVSPWDPLTLVVSIGVLVGAALVAAYWPARRATQLDPSRTLRYE